MWLIGRPEGCDLSIKNSGKEVAEDEARRQEGRRRLSQARCRRSLTASGLRISAHSKGPSAYGLQSRVARVAGKASLEASQKEVVFEVPDAPSKVPTLSECVSFGKAKYLLCAHGESRCEDHGAEEQGQGGCEEAEEPIVLPSAPSKEELARARREAAERRRPSSSATSCSNGCQRRPSRPYLRASRQRLLRLPRHLGTAWHSNGPKWTRSRRLLRRRLTLVWDRRWPS